MKFIEMMKTVQEEVHKAMLITMSQINAMARTGFIDTADAEDLDNMRQQLGVPPVIDHLANKKQFGAKLTDWVWENLITSATPSDMTFLAQDAEIELERSWANRVNDVIGTFAFATQTPVRASTRSNAETFWRKATVGVVARIHQGPGFRLLTMPSPSSLPTAVMAYAHEAIKAELGPDLFECSKRIIDERLRASVGYVYIPRQGFSCRTCPSFSRCQLEGYPTYTPT